METTLSLINQRSFDDHIHSLDKVTYLQLINESWHFLGWSEDWWPDIKRIVLILWAFEAFLKEYTAFKILVVATITRRIAFNRWNWSNRIIDVRAEPWISGSRGAVVWILSSTFFWLNPQDQVQQKWSALDATFFAMQNVTGFFFPFWSQVDIICNLVLLRPAECDHRACILFGDLPFPSIACTRDPARGCRVCFTSWQQDFPAHGSDSPWTWNNQSDGPCTHWHLSAQVKTWSLAN